MSAVWAERDESSSADDHHEERGDDEPDRHSLASQGDERQPEGDLDGPGREDDEIIVGGKPVGDLGPELGAPAEARSDRSSGAAGGSG